MSDLVDRSITIATDCLSAPSLADRWKHVQAVGHRAAQLAITVQPTDRPVLIAAAWLHDIGYGPELVDTGLHSLDGARYLQRLGLPPRIVALVAHHTGARFEASERGLTEALALYPYEDSPVMDALVAADLTIGPTGQSIEVHERIAEILDRYPAPSPVHAAIQRAQVILHEQARRVAVRLQPLTSTPGD